MSSEKMNELITYDVTEAAIEQMATEFEGLNINGIDDKAGYKQVDEARKYVKKKRVEVEKRRKELKKDALEYGRKVDSIAKALTEKLLRIENPLDSMQKKIDEEKEAKQKALIHYRKELLSSCLHEPHEVPEGLVQPEMPSDEELLALSIEDFNATMKAAEENYQLILDAIEKKRADEEAERQRIKAQEEENKRLKKQIAEVRSHELAAISFAAEEYKYTEAPKFPTLDELGNMDTEEYNHVKMRIEQAFIREKNEIEAAKQGFLDEAPEKEPETEEPDSQEQVEEQPETDQKAYQADAWRDWHKDRHKGLDALVARFIELTGRRPSDITLGEFIKWSHQQTLSPETAEA